MSELTSVYGIPLNVGLATAGGTAKSPFPLQPVGGTGGCAMMGIAAGVDKS